VPDPPTRADYQGDTVEPGVAAALTDVPYVPGGLEGCATGSDVDCPGTFAGSPYFGSQTLDVYLPPSGPATDRPVIVWIHGGLSVTGDKTDVGGVDYPADLLARQLARGFVVVSLNYRLNPLVDGPDGTIIPTAPVAAEDLDVAVRFLKANAGAIGADPARIVLWGHSWGGWAALLHATAPGLHTPAWVPAGLAGIDPRVAGVVAEAAPADLVSTLPISFAEVDRTGDVGPVDLDALDVAQLAHDSPVAYVDPSDTPVYAIAGPDDPLVPAADPNAMADRYAAIGRPDLYRLDVTDRAEGTDVPWVWRGHLPHPAAHRTELERWLDARRS
jgi:acetyl esterase/lipase